VSDGIAGRLREIKALLEAAQIPYMIFRWLRCQLRRVSPGAVTVTCRAARSLGH
jgi:hypothetical protein